MKVSKSEIIRGLIKDYCSACEDNLKSELDDTKSTTLVINEKQPSELQNIQIIDS